MHLTATQSLTAGMEPDTPQFVQMDLAGKALEDFFGDVDAAQISKKGKAGLWFQNASGKWYQKK